MDLPDFETQARRLRYRALGAACRDSRLRYLLLGHHEDDQAETVFMRIASGHGGVGLHGMQAMSAIPECWGLHGVHESGRNDSARTRLERLELRHDNLSMEHTQRLSGLRNVLASESVFEAGGVQIIRPLLTFSKRRLVATCRAHCVKWEEDRTNRDVWRTPRNAIRELLSNTTLPEAVRKEAMLSVAARAFNASHKNKAIAERHFIRCNILLFDVRSGGLVVRFPQLQVRKSSVNPVAWTSYLMKARKTTAIMLRRFVDMVTPHEDVPALNLRFAVLSMFPDLCEEDGNVDIKYQRDGFTVGGVQFQRLSSPLPKPRSNQKSQEAAAEDYDWKNLDPLFVWKLTREPFRESLPTLTIYPPQPPSLIPMSGILPPDTQVIPNTSSWSPWELWDGRYWIRVLNRSSCALIVRPFQPVDLQALKASLPSTQFKTLHRHLKEAAPDGLRWTIPVIAEASHNEDKGGKVLVLPTLGQAGQLDIQDETDVKKPEWEVRYKKVHFGYISDTSNARVRDFVTSWND